MSLESAEKLIIRLKEDENFRNRIVGLNSTDDFLEIIRKEGFTCTMEELDMVPMELSYDDLEQVSAGKRRPGLWGPGDWDKIKRFLQNLFG